MSMLHEPYDETPHGEGLAGVDEVGRGCLAGPVVAAAVILTHRQGLEDVADSKALCRDRRERLFPLLQTHPHGIGIATVEEIDRLNIYHATLVAMRRAIAALPTPPRHILIDGKALPRDLPCTATALVKGDARSQTIAAASILAKVTRDRLMQRLGEEFPQFGWANNAGYATRHHMLALEQTVTIHHRRSFSPVRESLQRLAQAA